MKQTSVMAGVFCVALLLMANVAFGWASPLTNSRMKLLTSPEFAGRGNGTPELAAIADSLIAWLSKTGLEPGFGDSWSQEFELLDLPDGRQNKGRNVAGFWPGRGRWAENTLLVTAHYDHLGRVDREGVGRPDSLSYFPGANDNASGVSIVLDLVNSIIENAPNHTNYRSVLFVFFGGEEVGLQGSSSFVRQRSNMKLTVDAVLNFDTVGVITDNKLYVSGLGSAAPFTEIVAMTESGDLALQTTQSIWGGSDHMAFIEHEIPALFVFGGPYPNYNRTTDTWSRLKPEDLVRVASFADALLRNMVSYSLPINWQQGYQAKKSRVAEAEENRNTWFGSLPDFGDERTGYALAGVFANSPAERAGLSKGDVLVEMSGQAVTDLVDFTRILRAHNPGDVIEVVVARNHLRLKFTVVLGNRSERQ